MSLNAMSARFPSASQLSYIVRKSASRKGPVRFVRTGPMRSVGMPSGLSFQQTVHVGAQRLAPVAGRKARGPDLGEVERRVRGARGDGALGAGVVPRGGDGDDGVAVAVRALEHQARDLRPAGGLARAGEVVGAEGRRR